MQTVQFVRNELDLGCKLNFAVHEQRASDFVWLLASLTQNATEFAEFELPDVPPLSYESGLNLDGIPIIIGPQQPIANKAGYSQAQNHAQILASQGILQVFLENCLNPLPFAEKDDKTFIPEEVIDNCHPSVQQRLKANTTPVCNTINVEGFYNTISEIKQSVNVAA